MILMIIKNEYSSLAILKIILISNKKPITPPKTGDMGFVLTIRL
jgi:hypothetical protein